MQPTYCLIFLAASSLAASAVTPYSTATVTTINQPSNAVFNRADVTNPTSLLADNVTVAKGAVGRNGTAGSAAAARLYWQVSAFRVSDLLAALGTTDLNELSKFTFTYRGVTEGSSVDLEDSSLYAATYLGQWEDSRLTTTDVPRPGTVSGANTQNMADTGTGATDTGRTLFATAIETLSGYSPATAVRQTVNLNVPDNATAQTLTAQGFDLKHLADDLAGDTDLSDNYLFFTLHLSPKLVSPAATASALNQNFQSVVLIPVEKAAGNLADGTYEVSGNLKANTFGFGAGLAQTGGNLRLELAGATRDEVFVTGDYSRTAGGISIGLLESPPVGTPIPLLHYTGTLTGAPPVTLETGTRFTLSSSQLGDGSDDVISATFSGAAASLVWTGAGGSTWDPGTPSNWKNGTVADKFLNLDRVTFDDSAASFSPSLTGTLIPGSVTFNTAADQYTLGGTGTLAGPGALNLTGAGSVLLLADLLLTGPVSISNVDGFLDVGNGGTTGKIGTGDLALAGIIRFNRSDNVVVPNSVAGTDGLFSKDGAGSLTLTGTHTGAISYEVTEGTLRVGDGSGRGKLAPGTASTTVVTTDPGTTLAFKGGKYITVIDSIIDGSGTLSFEGNGNPSESDYRLLAESDLFTGPVTIENCRVVVDDAIGDLGTPDSVKVRPGGALLLADSSFSFDSAVEIAGQGWNETGAPIGALRLEEDAELLGPITLAANSRIGTYGGSGYLSGDISGAFALEFFSDDPDFDGLISLYGNNTWSGGTTIKGAVVFASSASAFGTGPIAIDAHSTNEIERYSGIYFDSETIANPITVATEGFLFGDGGTSGSVDLDGGVIAPGGGDVGTLEIGTLNVNSGGIVDLRIDSSTISNDRVVISRAISIFPGARLLITDSAATPVALPDGTRFILVDFIGATLSGTFDGRAEGAIITAGSNTYVLHYVDGGKITLTATSSPPSPYATWAANAGLNGAAGKEAGFGDDPDRDGIDNGLEFILGGNPLSGNPSALVTLSTTTTDGLTLEFNRAPDSIGAANLQVDWGGSPAALTQSVQIGTTDVAVSGNSPGIDIDAPSPGKVTVRIPAANAVGGKLFARLRAVMP